jgi:hypothetical protein
VALTTRAAAFNAPYVAIGLALYRRGLAATGTAGARRFDMTPAAITANPATTRARAA